MVYVKLLKLKKKNHLLYINIITKVMVKGKSQSKVCIVRRKVYSLYLGKCLEKMEGVDVRL